MSELGMRPSIVWMKEYFNGRPVKGCELGVFKGINAERMIEMLNIATLDLVDLWITPKDLIGKYDYQKHYEMVVEKFEGKKGMAIWVMDTVEATEYCDDNSLDFVYVDADHSYEGCKRDMNAWWSKLKKGGVMVGHDYYCCVGVQRAVDEFVKAHNLKLITFDAIGIYDKVKYGEWLVIK